MTILDRYIEMYVRFRTREKFSALFASRNSLVLGVWVFLSSQAGAADETALARLADGEGCPGCDLSAAVLAGSNLSAADLAYANLKDVVFRGANLQGTLFPTANLRNAVFNQINLRNARFDEAYMDGASFTDARGFERPRIL